jgi:uncharacterized protein YcnI
MSTRPIARSGAILTATTLFVLLGAGVASAHVSAHSPDSPAKGGDAEIVFRVPNEEDTAHTVKVQVDFSTTSPLSNAAVKPVAGWTSQETMTTLATPVKMSNLTVTKAVRSITWTAPAGGGIAPGQFQEFTIAVEALPDNTDELVLPTIQTYENGDVVSWNQPTVAGQPEPDHPAPTLALAAASPVVQSTSDTTARWLGGIGLVIAALALGFGLGAFFRGRRPTATTTPAEQPRQESEV